MAKKSFEENMARLEEIVAQLEKDDAQLRHSQTQIDKRTKFFFFCPAEPVPVPVRGGDEAGGGLPHGAGQGRAAGGAADEGTRRRAHRK